MVDRLPQLIVTGSRGFADYPALARCLDEVWSFRSFDQLWHGGAAGADRLASSWASLNRVRTQVWLPDWNAYGKGAGLVRSRAMVDSAHPLSIVAVFCKGPLDSSAGTRACVGFARAAGLRIWRIVTSWP